MSLPFNLLCVKPLNRLLHDVYKHLSIVLLGKKTWKFPAVNTLR